LIVTGTVAEAGGSQVSMVLVDVSPGFCCYSYCGLWHLFQSIC